MEKIKKTVERFIKEGYNYEIFIQRCKKLSIETSSESLESLTTSEETGIGIRVLKNNKIGFSYTSTEEEDSIKEAVVKAMEICDLQPQDKGNTLIDKLEKSRCTSFFDKEGTELSTEAKTEFTLSLERKAKELDLRIKGVRKTSFTERILEVELYNSYGVHFYYRGTFYTVLIATLAQEAGDSAISWEYRGTRKFSELKPEEIAHDVVFKSVSLLNPKSLSTGSKPVVFFRDSFATLAEAFSSLFLGDSLVKGKTLLKDRVGEKIGAEVLTLVDDGTREQGFATVPYDDEGIPQGRNVLIERGVFKGFLHSLYTANLTGEKATGNSKRQSFKSPPTCGITNLYVKEGNSSLTELLASEEEVLLITDLMGLHTVDTVSGEFSLGAAGVLYRKGKPLHAVRGITVAGNILDLWNKIVAVGNDLKFYGNVGSPSVLVREVAIGGN